MAGPKYGEKTSLMKWMGENGKTQRNLADVIGTTEMTAHKKLHGVTDFKTTEVRAICEAWGISSNLFD